MTASSPFAPKAAQKNEEKLIREAQAGNEEAFIELYHRYVGLLYGFVFQKIGQREDAEDLVAETFFQALKVLRQFSFRSSFKNWLFGIAKNLLLAHYREKYRRPIELDENMPNSSTKIDDEKAKSSREQELKKILAHLPERYRDVLSLRFLRGYSVLETAHALGISEENAKILQHRALKKANKIASAVTFPSPQS